MYTISQYVLYLNMNDIQYGKYRHYRTDKLYEVIAVARHSETLEEMVVYNALYRCEKFGDDQVWVKPKTMFLEQVEHNGRDVPRFTWVDE